MKSKNPFIKILSTLALILLINYGGQMYYKRFDLTQDQRYTLSEETISMLEELEDPMLIKVYLQGDFPSEFKRLQAETAQFLDELNAVNDLVKFRFIDPLSNAKELVNKGLQASRLTVQEGGKVSEAVISLKVRNTNPEYFYIGKELPRVRYSSYVQISDRHY